MVMLVAAVPFIMVRMTHAPVEMPEKMQEVIAVNAAYPGSADAYWFADGAGMRQEQCREEFARWLPFCEPSAKAGVDVEFQQGVTLGHGAIDDPAGGGGPSRLHPFTDDVWQMDRNGKQVRMFCPRSPEVLAYEEEWIATLCKTLKPKAVWLDDDLRIKTCKRDYCFCDRCLAAFNRRFGHAFTRQELAGRLFGPAPRETVRREMAAFGAESMAIYGAAARRGADRSDPTCVIAYQSVDSSALEDGLGVLELLKALSGDGRYPTAVRIGSGCYEENEDDLIYKLHTVAREAERCRKSGLPLRNICYEQETYCREILHKSSEAALVESALALAAGCDSLSEYRWDGKRDEPLQDYREFAALTAVWRPYLERVASFSATTVLGGIARFVGGDADLLRKMNIADPVDLNLSMIGVPVSVAEAGPTLWYVDAQTLEEWASGDAERLLADGRGAVVDAAVWEAFLKLDGRFAAGAQSGRLKKFDFRTIAHRGARLPTTAERKVLLDAMDALARTPVRIDRSHRFVVYPRVNVSDGRTAAVTIYNASAGKSFATEVTVRHPAGTYPVWVRPCEADVPLYVRRRSSDEVTVVVPEVPGRQVGTVVFCDRCPETAAEVRHFEESADVPPFDEKAPGWLCGYRLQAVRLWEVSAPRAVVPGSVRVFSADGRALAEGKDYRLNLEFGTVGLIGETAKSPVNPLRLAYDCRLERLDTWFVNREGNVDFLRGESVVARPEPASLPPGAKLLGRFWVRGGGRFDDGVFFPYEGEFMHPPVAIPADRAIPKTLAKLRAGEAVKILAWGGSVTECGYLHQSDRWQSRIVSYLRGRFPLAKIELIDFGWGGRNIWSFLNAPAGHEFNYEKGILDARPDLVLREFVNDAGAQDAALREAYGRVLGDFRKRGIELVILAPSFSTPPWMGLGACSGHDGDPRPCTKALRDFAIENGVGFVDSSLRWGHLWREGLPFQTLLVNGVNHPDAFALGFYVDAFKVFFESAQASPLPQ